MLRDNDYRHVIDQVDDFLHDVLSPPPVGPIADALAGMKDRRGAGALAAHLNDPADTSDDAKRAARALVEIGGTSELPEIERFFALYRTSAIDDDLVAAVDNAAAALLHIGGDAQKALVAGGATAVSTDKARPLKKRFGGAPSLRASATGSIRHSADDHAAHAPWVRRAGPGGPVRPSASGCTGSW